MHNSSPDLKFIHFADDTTTVTSSSNEGALFVAVNRSLASIDQWLSVNRLSLNIKKTKFMIVSDNNITHNSSISIRHRKVELIVSNFLT